MWSACARHRRYSPTEVRMCLTYAISLHRLSSILIAFSPGYICPVRACRSIRSPRFIIRPRNFDHALYYVRKLNYRPTSTSFTRVRLHNAKQIFAKKLTPLETLLFPHSSHNKLQLFFLGTLPEPGKRHSTLLGTTPPRERCAHQNTKNQVAG